MLDEFLPKVFGDNRDSVCSHGEWGSISAPLKRSLHSLVWCLSVYLSVLCTFVCCVLCSVLLATNSTVLTILAKWNSVWKSSIFVLWIQYDSLKNISLWVLCTNNKIKISGKIHLIENTSFHSIHSDYCPPKSFYILSTSLPTQIHTFLFFFIRIQTGI